VLWVGEASERAAGRWCAQQLCGDSGAEDDLDEVRGGLVARGAAERSQPPLLRAVAGLGKQSVRVLQEDIR